MAKNKQKSKKRKRKERTEEQKTLRAMRKASDRHVVRFEADLTEDQIRRVLSIMACLGYISRKVANLYRKRLENLRQRNDYKKLRLDYHTLKEKLGRIGEDHEDYEALVEALAEIAAEINEIVVAEGIVPEAGRELAAYIASKHKHVHSVFALSVFEDVWQGVEKNLYGNAKKLSAGEFHHSIRTKQANRAITIKEKDGKLVFCHKDGIGTFSVKCLQDDIFLAEEEAAIAAFLADKYAEEKALAHFMETGEITDTFRPCYVTLTAEQIRGKWRIWCLVTVEGQALPKKKRDGSPRFHRGVSGKIGFDLGPSSYAACGANVCEMANLAERSPNTILKSEAKERNLQRKMDRSRRANNPDNYNDDGTIKKGKKTWRNSKTYQRDKARLADIKRRNAASRKYAIQETVNRLREHGDEIITERQSIAGWAKKAKPGGTHTDKNTSKKRANRRKRFGRSIQRRCPGMMRAELKKKFPEYHEVDIMFRASQYDHELDDYVKKKLSERTHRHADGRASPRDAYSSFLLWCSDDEYKRVDRTLCIIRFDDYYDRVQAMIEDYKERGVKVLNSGF